MPIIYEPDEKQKKRHTCNTGKYTLGVRWSERTPGTIWQCPVCEKYWVSRKYTDSTREWKRVRWYHYNTQMKIIEQKQKEKKK